MYRTGISTIGFTFTENNFAALAEAGIRDVEISRPLGEYPYLEHKAIRALADRHGVKLWSYHLPFAGTDTLDIASADEELRRRTVEILAGYIRKGGDIGVDKFVIHPGSEPNSEDTEVRGELLKHCMESLNTLAEIAAEYGAVIAVEELPRSCLGRTAEEILQLISANDKLRVCFDSNHLLMDDNLNFLKKLAGKIVTVHISDYDFLNERHWLPGEGKVDWTAQYEGLKASGYEGVWLYEIRQKKPASILEGRRLEFSDYVRNAREIMEGRPITVFRKPKTFTGLWE